MQPKSSCIESCLTPLFIEEAHYGKVEHRTPDGIKPYMCPIANMIGDRILEVLNYEATYMADMDIDVRSGHCVVKYAIFEDVGKIGQVSDWTKI